MTFAFLTLMYPWSATKIFPEYDRDMHLNRKRKLRPFSLFDYRFNNNACCTSVHDDYIYTAISNLLTTSCMRKYTELEELMCLGCHPYESSYIDREKRRVYICIRDEDVECFKR